MDMIYDDLVNTFLRDRDIRVEYQKMLVGKYKKPVVCIRVNYPGINKTNFITSKINEIIYNVVVGLISDKIILKNSYNSLEGPISILVADMNPFVLKRICVNIEENHKLGRLVDIDVYDENYYGISRLDLNLNKRKCYICDDYAFLCARSKKHLEDEVISYIENTVSDFCNDFEQSEKCRILSVYNQ